MRPLPALLMAAVLGLPFAALEAQASRIAAIPTRIVMAEGARSAAVTLLNRGTEAVACRVVLQRFEMDEAGRLHASSQDLPDILERQLLVTPSQVRLPPGGSQVFRMLLQRPSDLAPGEYRVNLTFLAETPLEEAGPLIADAPGPLRIRVQVGISVPLIVRHHSEPPTVGLEAPIFVPGPAPRLTVKLRRDGMESVFGDLMIYEISGSGEGRLVASRRGIAVYPPLAYRSVDLPLLDPPPAPGARLRAVFIGRDQEVRAESELTVPWADARARSASLR